MSPFHGWGSTPSRLEPLRGDNLLSTTNFPDIVGAHLLTLEGKKLYCFCLTGLKTMVLLIGKWMVLFLRKSSFMMLGLAFSSKLDWCYYIMSTVKTVSKKIGASLRSMKFLSPEAALHHCPEVATMKLLDKLQKCMCRTVGPSLPASLERLAHR